MERGQFFGGEVVRIDGAEAVLSARECGSVEAAVRALNHPTKWVAAVCARKRREQGEFSRCRIEPEQGSHKRRTATAGGPVQHTVRCRFQACVWRFPSRRS